jgi:hypothetical protein
MKPTTIKKQSDNDKLVVNQIIVRNIDRTAKDIHTYRNAHIAAENVHYPNRTRLYDLYEDVDLDGHLTGIIGKRIEAVLNKTLHYKVDGKKIDAMDDVIESEKFREIIRLRMLAKFWGISGLEFIPGKNLDFLEIPRKHIKPEKELITVNQSDQEGTCYTNISNILVFGKKTDLGLLLKCSPYALYKKGDMADWAQYIEIFGQPVRIMKYDAYDAKTKTELKQVVDEAGSSLALMIPKQVDFEMMDGKISNGDGQLQERFKNACNDEMSVIVLGNTETTSNSNGGSNAKSKEHGKQQLEFTKSDIKEVANALNSMQFFSILKSYGLPVKEGGKFVYEKEINIEELKHKAELDTKVVSSVNLPVDDDYWYETYNINKPANYAQLKAKKEAEAQKPPATPSPAPKPPHKPPTGQKQNLSSWDNFRNWMADFFDPAH